MHHKPPSLLFADSNSYSKLDELVDQLEQLRSVVGNRELATNSSVTEALAGPPDYPEQSPRSTSGRKTSTQQSSPQNSTNESSRQLNHGRDDNPHHSQSQLYPQEHALLSQNSSFLQPPAPEVPFFSSCCSRSLESVELHGQQVGQMFHE